MSYPHIAVGLPHTAFTLRKSLGNQVVTSGNAGQRTVGNEIDIAQQVAASREHCRAEDLAPKAILHHIYGVIATPEESAIRRGRALAAKGHRLPLTDLVVATTAKRLNTYVYSTDPDFDLIDDLKRFRP